METEIINNTKLNEICLSLIASATAYSLPVAPFIDVLYNTGLRVNELFQRHRWSLNEDGIYYVRLEKSSGERRIMQGEIPLEVQSILSPDHSQGWSFTQRQINFFVRNHTGYRSIKVGDKEIVCHLFRYNYCRKLQSEGYPLTYIRDQITHSSNNVTSGYLNNSIIGVKWD